jgi:hypothetical protein
VLRAHARSFDFQNRISVHERHILVSAKTIARHRLAIADSLTSKTGARSSSSSGAGKYSARATI